MSSVEEIKFAIVSLSHGGLRASACLVFREGLGKVGQGSFRRGDSRRGGPAPVPRVPYPVGKAKDDQLPPSRTVRPKDTRPRFSALLPAAATRWRATTGFSSGGGAWAKAAPRYARFQRSTFWRRSFPRDSPRRRNTGNLSPGSAPRGIRFLPRPDSVRAPLRARPWSPSELFTGTVARRGFLPFRRRPAPSPSVWRLSV